MRRGSATPGACLAVTGLLLVALTAPLPAAGAPHGSGGGWTGPWASETALSPHERRELAERRAVVEARARELAEGAAACGDLRAVVRERLVGVEHVRAVEVGPVLLTSDPPRMPVAFAVALRSGRVVWDRLVVTVPVRPRVVPLGAAAGADRVAPCPPPGR